MFLVWNKFNDYILITDEIIRLEFLIKSIKQL